jgi:hypothetical protein
MDPMKTVNEQPPIKKKWSKGQLLILVCLLGLFDTGWAWFRNNRGWFVIDLIFYPVLFIAVVAAKKSN